MSTGCKAKKVVASERHISGIFLGRWDSQPISKNNWDALVDCLSDPHVIGHNGQGMAVVIEDADLLAGFEEIGLFISVLGQAASHANLRLDVDGLPIDLPVNTLHFIFRLTSISALEFNSKITDPEQVVEVHEPYLMVT